MTTAGTGGEPRPSWPPRRRLPDRDQPHFQKKKMVVLAVVGVLILLAVALLIHSGAAAPAYSGGLCPYWLAAVAVVLS